MDSRSAPRCWVPRECRWAGGGARAGVMQQVRLRGQHGEENDTGSLPGS